MRIFPLLFSLLSPTQAADYKPCVQPNQVVTMDIAHCLVGRYGIGDRDGKVLSVTEGSTEYKVGISAHGFMAMRTNLTSKSLYRDADKDGIFDFLEQQGRTPFVIIGRKAHFPKATAVRVDDYNMAAHQREYQRITIKAVQEARKKDLAAIIGAGVKEAVSGAESMLDAFDDVYGTPKKKTEDPNRKLSRPIILP